MQRNFEERSHPLAQLSEKARRIAHEVDENLTDALSLMELNFSFDGFGKLCNDLGKTCEVSKLAKIPAKCVDLAKKFADEVSADWLGLDVKPTDVESVKITCETVEASNDRSEEEHDDLAISGVSNDKSENVEALNDKSEEEHDDLAISGVSNYDSESTNSNDASYQGSEEKPLSVSEVCGCHLGSSIVVPGEKTDKIKTDVDSVMSLPVTVNSVDQNALVELSKSHQGSSTLGPSDKTAETALVEVSKSHEGNLVLGPSNKTVETAAEAANLVNFSKPIEFGDFEDVDLKDDWEDDTDYDLDLVSYYESKKMSSEKKLAAKFISKLRGSMKSRSVEVVHKPDANSTDSDWEFL